MKKVLIILALLLPMVVSAHDIAMPNEDGVTIYYKWMNNNTELAVSYQGGSYQDNYYRYSGNVVIPESVTYNGVTYPVTSIDDYAFYFCSLTSVTIGNSVTSIGECAFHDCRGLTSLTIGNSVISIGNGAFEHCFGLTNVTIPNSVTTIGEGAFWNCRGLTSVTIPNSVTNIGSMVFKNCTALTSVDCSDLAAWCNIQFGSSDSNPLYYAHHLFVNGEEIKDLVIPDSVTSIGDYAFWDCSGLTSVTIPNSVTNIGSSAFTGCI